MRNGFGIQKIAAQFYSVDDVLEKIFGDESSVEGMYNDKESDIDRQLEN